MSEQPETSPSVSQWLRWIGPAVFAVALLIRLMGIQWGLPDATKQFSLHPDEPIILAYARQINLAEGKLDPGFYNYGTLYLTTLNFASKVVAAYAAPDATDRNAHLAGRVISALAGAGLAWLVVVALRRMGVGAIGAAVGGLSIAFSPALVVHSRFQTVDMLAVFLLMAGLVYALRWCYPIDGIDPSPNRTAVWAGLLVGLSAGTKYTGILGLLALGLMAWTLAPTVRWKTLGTALATCMAGFFIGTPGLILNFSKFKVDFKYEMAHTSTGHGLVFMATPSGFEMHFTNLLMGLGGIAVLMGGAGLIWMCIKRVPGALALVLFGLAYYILIGRAEVKFMRYVFPLIPLLSIGLGWLVHHAHVAGGKLRVTLVPLSFLALAGFGSGGLAGAAAETVWMQGEDPRDAAAGLLRKEGVGKTVGIVSDAWFYTPTLWPTSAAPRPIPFASRLEFQSQTNNPKVVQYIPPDGLDARKPWAPELIDEVAPDFIVISSFELEDVERIWNAGIDKSPEAEWNRAERFMKRLAEQYTPYRVFGPAKPSVHDMEYTHPTVRIWKRTKT
ncbi:MAG: phospholipid carrier-dependent glycosyltransferase [Chthonomonas sp.]|nr:phospholipid carrier-dependent glycosyltransferase [Chthonomonas sp.]